MTIAWHQWIGVLGSLLYICAFLSLQMRLLDAHRRSYLWLNFGAAGCVLVSLHYTFHLPSLITQIVCISVSALGLAKRRAPTPAPVQESRPAASI